MDSVESYESAMQRLKELTDEEDLNLIVKKFIENEDRNFSLFNYCNEQNLKIEQLNEQHAAIERDIDTFQEQGTQMEQERKEILHSMESKEQVRTPERTFV